jgi:prepilin-type N-terminal cleavage/methylation domain-containing protein
MSFASRQFRLLRRNYRAAFTLVEIVIALAVLGVMASGCYIGFNSINTYAVTSRLYSEAQTAAQNQIDLILSKEPFDITGAYVSGSFDATVGKVPIEVMTVAELDALAASGVIFPTTPPTSIPLTTNKYYPYYPYYRSGSGQPVSKEAFIYQDPVSGKVIVTGTLTTTVTDSGTTMAFAGTTSNLNIRKATASVTYSFRNKNYNVALDTLRTADQ